MKTKLLVPGVIIAGFALITFNANASDEFAGAVVGGATGAIVGHALGGHDGAVVGTALGALVGASAARDQGYEVDYYPTPAVAYGPPPPPVYAPPPEVIYSSPRVVYVAPPVVYPPVVSYGPPVYYRYEGWRGGWRDRDDWHEHNQWRGDRERWHRGHERRWGDR